MQKNGYKERITRITDKKAKKPSALIFNTQKADTFKKELKSNSDINEP